MNAGFKCKINANITVSLKRCGVTSKFTSPSSSSSPDAWMGMEVTNVTSSGQFLRVSFNKDGSLTLQSPSEKVLSFERFVSSRVSSLGNRVIFSNLSSSCSNLLTTKLLCRSNKFIRKCFSCRSLLAAVEGIRYFKLQLSTFKLLKVCMSKAARFLFRRILPTVSE